MTEQHPDRRLAAILAMDVAGYSRLMGAHEVETLRTLKGHRRGLIDPAITAYRGRTVKTTGDGILIEFASVVDAVSCAVAIQRGMAGRNASVPAVNRIEFRAGINIGDIIVEGKDIYGDGVNVAARLEALAEPGGLCVSKTVRDQVRDKLLLRFDDRGEQQLKNIARPVRVFSLAAGTIANLPESVIAGRGTRRRRPLPLTAAAGTLALGLMGMLLAWHFAPADGARGAKEIKVERPTVAVLPFANISGDKDEDYFIDGLTEDLVTELARIPRLTVKSRNATATYKGKSIDIPLVGRDLGVRYMVEGSVRRSGEQMRVTAQLIEVDTNAHVWAEHYDRPATEIFAVQDEITRAIATRLVANITQEDLEQAKRKPPASLSVYELFLRGREQIILVTPEANLRAIGLLEQALTADPSYADVMGVLSQAYIQQFVLHWGPDSGRGALERARDTAERGLAIDPMSVYAARSLSLVYLFTHQFDDAIALLEGLLKFDPSQDAVLLRLGDVYTYSGQPQRGTELIRKAFDLNPRTSASGYAFLARGLLLLGRHEEALGEVRTCVVRAPAFRPCREIAAVAYAEMGRLEEAQVEMQEARRIDPTFTLASAPQVLPFKDPRDLRRFLDGLRKAGLPE